MAPSRVTGGLAQSSSSSGIFFQGDGHSQAVANSHLSQSFGNSSSSIPRTGHPSLGGDMNNSVLNSVANSGPGVGGSSVVTDANSAFSGGPRLQRSASINTDPRMPASPMSFTSNNISISGNSAVDGSSVVQQGNHQESNAQQIHHNQLQQRGASSATSLPAGQSGQVPLSMGARAPGSYLQQDQNLSQVQKKPRLDIKQEDILQQQVLQQLLQRQDSMQFQAHNPQLQSILQQQRLRQQQQIIQSMPPLQRAHLQQQQQLQMRQQQMQQQAMQPAPAPVKRPYDGGVCARRMMQYLYHQRQRPAENTIAYWRKFVAEYYAPRAKKRWCLSLYENVGHHALGVFPQAAMEAWQCDICGSKSGRGFEATYDVLPRLNEIKFGSGVIDELLFFDLPRESRLPSGLLMLEYGKTVQESVYEQLRVVREGQLRVIFTHDLKILSWDFCVRRHEELLPRRVVAPQVNQLVQVAQKCQSTISESGPDGVSQQDLQANSNMVVTAGRQLAKSLELQSLNDLGFSKRYVRCLQISEVVNSMKDLIDFCGDQKSGPIDSLKNYPRHSDAAKQLQMQKMQEMEQLANAQGLPSDRNTLNKLMALYPGINNAMNSNNNRGALSGPAQAAMALSNYQSLLSRQNSMNSNSSSHQQEQQHQQPTSSFNNSRRSPSPSFAPGSVQNLRGPRGYSSPSPSPSPHLPPALQQQQQQQQQRNGILPQQGGNQALQQQMMQQLLHEMSSNSNRGANHLQQQQPSVSAPNGSGGRNGVRSAVASPAMSGGAAMSGGGAAAAQPPSRSNSFKSAPPMATAPTAAAETSDSGGGGTSEYNHNHKAAATVDLPQSLQDDIQDIPSEFTDTDFFNSDFDYGWKA
ncbi:Probable transcriptional regulator SLK2 [Linum grandiflorum]